MVIPDWAEQDRPREKMMANGAASLTDAELLAILIRTGRAANPTTSTPAQTALDLGRQLLGQANHSLVELSYTLLQGHTEPLTSELLKGIGPAKACTIQAALELGRRYHKELEIRQQSNELITSSEAVFAHFNRQLSDLDYEELWALYCSNNGRVLHKHRISEGGINFSGADVKKVLRPAIQFMASRVALCHNHPHSAARPSQADRDVTQAIAAALKLIDVRLVDHVIIADGRYYSFADNGLI